MWQLQFVMLTLIIVALDSCAAAPIFISDQPDLIVFSQQDWGQLGLDTAAFTPGEQVHSMQISEKAYTKGIGTHAVSKIILDLRGQYLAFEAEVGVQRQTDQEGSVVFQVFVDDKKVFDSGVMRQQTSPVPITVSLVGADELKLVVTDAGDSTISDAANWAEARLIPDLTAISSQFIESVDVGQFAQVLSWDPDRKDGTHAERTQEFPVEDLFLETEVISDAQGNCTVPTNSKGVGCIGLQWLEPRHVQKLDLNFTELNAVASIEGITAEYWGPLMERGASSGSRWQGKWKPIKGEIRRVGNSAVLDVDWKDSPDKSYGTTKVRWIIPTSLGLAKVKRPSAYTDSPWAIADIVMQVEKPQPSSNARVSAYNGEIVTDSGASIFANWDLSKPLRLKVRYGIPRRWMFDRTSLRITLPSGGFGVTIDDLLKNKSIYVKDFGFYVAVEPTSESLDHYKKRIAGLETVLERVREMPDQTLVQSIEHTHRPDADLGPTLISLACENHKFVLHRTGTLIFDKAEDPWVYADAKHCKLSLDRELGTNKEQTISRSMEDGWMPIVNIQVQDNGVIYRQRTFVAPYGDALTSNHSPKWLNPKPLCVSDYEIENPSDKPIQAATRFEATHHIDPLTVIKPEVSADIARYMLDGNVIAWVDSQNSCLKLKADGNGLTVSGTLPAKGKVRFAVYIPAWTLGTGDIPVIPENAALLARTKVYWRDVMADSMQIELPDKYFANLIRASQVHCLLAARSEEEKRVAAWIGSANYGPLESEAHSVIRGMMYTGNLDFAKRSLEFFIKRYNQQGFLTTGYTFLGTGWHLWALGEYYSLTRDKKWMKSIAPEVARVCKWAMTQREKTKKLDAYGNKVIEWGLMPPGVLADWSVYSYYYYLNGNFSAGLKSAGEALMDIGYPEADRIVQSADELAQETLRSFSRVRTLAPVVPLKDGTWVQSPPTQAYSIWPTSQMYPESDSGRSWCYDVELGSPHLVPLGVLPADGHEASRMMDYMEDVQFLANGWFYYPAAESEKDWFNRGGFAKVQPYYARTVEIYALQDEVKPFIRSYFNSVVSLLNREDLSLWEHFVNGAFNKTHETGYFLYQSRTMLAMERGKELWIAPFVTSNWMKDGMTVEAKCVPSHFGAVSYHIHSHVNRGFIEAVISIPTRETPKALVVRLRHPEGKKIKSVTVNGKKHTDFNPARDTVRIETPRGIAVLKAAY